jgi:protein-S-isoprenylcysteine O-methyltransferase Ste14
MERVMPAGLPVPLVGILVGAYWLRVLHLARKTRRSAGHGANVIPPDQVGQITRAVWFPVVVLWIALPLSAPFISNPPAVLRPLIVSWPLAWLGVILAIVSFSLTLICWKQMGKSWRMGVDPAETTPLIVTGPFARVRHPIYALSSVLMLATVAVVPSPLMMLVAAVHLLLLQLEARREEKHLLKRHGPTYREYCDRVGRFLPRI